MDIAERMDLAVNNTFFQMKMEYRITYYSGRKYSVKYASG